MIRRTSDPKSGSKHGGMRWIGVPRGATMVEYLVLLVLGVLIFMAGIQLFGGGLYHQFENATEFMARAMGDEDAQKAKQEGERQASDGRRAGDDDGALVEAPGGPDRDRQDIGRVENEGARGSVGGINPLILLLVIGGILGLGYFFFDDDED